MKRIKYLSVLLILILTGCLNNKSMEGITIYTTSYPIEYVTNELYGDYSSIKSIYPNGVNINEFKVTDQLIKEYKDSDMYIFNSLTKEKDYVKKLRQMNKKLMIIDVTSDITYDYKIEELWLDPSKLLSLANNIKKGFNEYIKNNPVLINSINDNYTNLKITLTDLESKYHEELENKENKTIIVNSDMFMFLNKYGLNVISLDKNNKDYNNNIVKAKELINSGNINNIFIPDTDNGNELENMNANLIKLNTISNLTDSQRQSTDYISLIEENLEIIKNN